ncbi:MAG: MFS transporter [Pirellulaceae bacterium]|nr:MAG: MFS transporter [Pirellulaceae bacterium]
MQSSKLRWYEGVTWYQWTVVIVASAGWVFDAFEGQLFNVERDQMLAELLRVGQDHPEVRKWGEYFLGVFLVGGTIGGIGFGWLADRIGRNPTMALTILFYSVFSGLTYFATELWQVGVLRFLVAMGVGGEWAVGASLVAEVVPSHARAHLGGLFHSTSVLGVWLAAWVGLLAPNWRVAFLVGVLPALLVVAVRWWLRESPVWLAARQQRDRRSATRIFQQLLIDDRRWRLHAVAGACFAAVGLGTFWTVTVAGQDLAKWFLLRQGISMDEATQRAKFAYGNIQLLGTAAGMLAFGPLARRWGRKKTFIFYHLASLVVVPVTCFAPSSYGGLLLLLPLYGAFTVGIHAGYAIYFPELFPHHLRATGSGFCFNGGRLLASVTLLFSGWLKSQPNLDPPVAISIMSLLFLVGIILLWFLPETRDQELPG